MYTVKEIVPSNQVFAEDSAADEAINEIYELEKCVQWIKQRNATRVCVQFSENDISRAPRVVHALESKLEQKLFILGDTSYGSCCVDEVAAQHVNADSIIHFGHACLSPSERIPVLYIFNKEYIDLVQFFSHFESTFGLEDSVLLFYDVSYRHVIDSIKEHLKQTYSKFIVADLCAEEQSISPSLTAFGRNINVPDGKNLSDYQIVFIGPDGQTAANFKYLLPGLPFFMYNPSSPSLQIYEINLSRFLRKRMFLIEALKDVKNLGILIGTLCVKSYLQIVERIKCLTKPKAVRCYVISVGKINVAKLANFPEMDAYVLVSCSENTLLDSKDFLQPIVTPYEVELAFNSAYKWSEKYITDFTTLLPGNSNYVEEDFNSTEEANVSLVTGHVQKSFTENTSDGNSSALVSKGIDSMTIAESQGCSFLNSRSWVGLDPQLGQTAVEEATQGRSGIPFKYENENV